MTDILKYEELKKNEDKFGIFYNRLVKTNEKFNLTAVTEKNEVAVKHFIDSLMGIEFIDVDKSVVDVGSGAGFPSLPMAIDRKDVKFTLVESNNKKCGFLNEIKEELQLENVDVLCARAEDIALKAEYRENFDYAVARAVAQTNTLLEYLLPFVKVGGKALLWKGESYGSELENSKNALNILGGEVKSVKKYSLGEYGERYIVVIEKIKSTPAKYPRGLGKERKCPL
ncbi:MAG: 16S rRNA (guanine(527)-N(7))-methyltransferase RsmG [Clostridia bacterium]|nr:16S rRNA (guanine(527)-N(7))-methyltransferase RsmG [Clostridia bacterium]